MWYTPLGSRPASAECSQTYQKLVQGERSAIDTPIRGIISITGGKRLARMPFSLVSPFRRAACGSLASLSGYDIVSARLTVSLAKSITTRGNQVG